MRSAAAAFAWEFQKRLRWGLIAVGLYFVGLAIVQSTLGPRSPIHPLKEMTFAFTVSIPLCAAFMYFLAVFSYGLAGDLTARHSLYPARMFTLPISTAALAGWPMLYGTIAMAALWTATAMIALLPVHAPVPLVWPGFFAAAFIAWLQERKSNKLGLPVSPVASGLARRSGPSPRARGACPLRALRLHPCGLNEGSAQGSAAPWCARAVVPEATPPRLRCGRGSRRPRH
jgi:hypothetical protein